MPLKQLCERYENFTKKSKNELLRKMDGKLLVQLMNCGQPPTISNGNVPPVPEYYVTRRLRSRTHISRKIVRITTEKSAAKDFLLFVNLEMYDLTGLVKKYGNGNFKRSSEITNQNELTCQAILLEKGASSYAKEFQKICKMTCEPVHVLKCEKSDTDNKSEVKRLEWVESKGSLKTLYEFIHSQQDCFSETEFIENPSQFPNSMKSFCIAELPGNGKSTLMAKCAEILIEQNRKEFYTQYVIIGEFIKELIATVSPANTGDDSAIKYILEEPEEMRSSTSTPNKSQEVRIPNSRIFKVLSENSCESTFGRAFVKAFVKSPGVNCDYMFDGLDELPQNQLELAYSVIKYLRKYKKNYIRVWVTTRKDLLEELEESLGVLGHTICPFKDEDQVEMLTSYWQDGKNNLAKLKEFAEHCLQELKSDITEGQKDIAGIPLLCHLVAEVYQEKALKYANSGDDGEDLAIFKINTTKLYEEFIHKRFEKSKGAVDRKKLEYEHMQRAIQLLLPPNVANQFKLSITSFVEDTTPVPKKELLRLGIIQSRFGRRNDTQRFIHKTIAEYFAAYAVLQIFNKIVECHTTNQDSDRLTDLFTLLCKHVLSTLRSEIILSNISIQSCQRQSFKFKYPNICHFLNLLLQSRLNICTLDSISTHYERMGSTNLEIKLWQSLHAAVISNFTGMATEIITLLNRRFPKTEQKRHFQKKVDEDKESCFKCLLFFAAKYGCEQMMKNVRIFFKDWTGESVIRQEFDRTHFPPTEGKFKTLLHIAVEAGNFWVVKCLLEKHGYTSQLGDEKYKNLFHFCLLKSNKDPVNVIKSKIEIIDLLSRESNAIFFRQDAFNYSILSLMTKKVNLELLFKLLEHLQNKNLKITSCPSLFGRNILHLLPTDHYDENMTPEKYDEALQKVQKYFQLDELLNAKDRFQLTPVDVAVSALDLLDETITIFSEYLNKTDTIFRAIVGQRSPAFLNKLISYGADCSRKLSGGKTVLHYAAEKYNYGAVMLFTTDKFLAYVNAKDDQGNTPLHICLEKRNDNIQPYDQYFDCENESLKRKLSSRSDSSDDEEDSTKNSAPASDKKSKYNYKIEGELEPNNQHRIITRLIECGARIDELNNEGKAPLHVAIDICNGLEEEDINVLKKTQIFDVPTFSLALRGIMLNEKLGSTWHPDLMTTFSDLLITKGASLDYIDVNGSTLLHLAARKHSMGVQYLLLHGLSPTRKNNLGKTPLEFMECADQCPKYNCRKIRKLLE